MLKMAFINWTEPIGQIISGATTSATGNLFVTLLIIIILIMAVALMFGIRLEFTAIVILPLMLSYMAYYSEFVVPGVVLLFYLGFVITKNFIFR